MLSPDELITSLDRILMGQATEADITAVRLGLQQRIFNLDFGTVNSNELHIGDRIYQGADVESLKGVLQTFLGERERESRSSSERQFLNAMRDDVELRLQQSLHQSVLISLRKKPQPKQVNPTWKRDVLIADKVPEPIPDEELLRNIFHRSDIKGKLLILGEPGSGKTTTTLELARELLDRAEREADYPIPVLFNLSSWKNGKSLFDWIVDELKDHVRQDISRSWLEKRKLLPMLDGLDELKAEHQEACVEAINQQLLSGERSLAYLVVCSRREEYNNYENKLLLNGAICLRELTNDQIQIYLADVGHSDLWQTLSDDKNLLKLVRSPLLLNITILAYQQTPFERWQTLRSTEARIEYLLDAYIQQMIERPIQDNLSRKERFPKPSKARKLLTYLAKQLQRESQTEFGIEGMQPTWLITDSQRRSFKRTLILTYITFAGIFPSLHRLVFVFLWLILMLVILASNGFRAVNFGNQSIGFINLIVNLLILFISVLFNGLIWGSILLAIFGLSNNIKPVENLRWSWNKAKSGFKPGWERIFVFNLFNPYWILYGMGVAAVFVFLATVILSPGNLLFGFVAAIFIAICVGTPLGIISSYLFGFLSGLRNALTEGLKGSEIRKKVVPNQGIWRSLRNGIYLGTPLCLFSILVLANFYNSFRYMALNYLEFSGSLQKSPALQETIVRVATISFILENALLVGLVGFLFGGGEACIKHLSLRLILYKQKHIPWNYACFLNSCTERRLLQRVGGRYRFVHRLLQDHFAAMPLRSTDINK